IVPMLRLGRPSLWAKRNFSRIIVAEPSGCQTLIIPSSQCSTASAPPARDESTSSSSIRSFPGLLRTPPCLQRGRGNALSHLSYSGGVAANTINQQLAAVRRIAHEAADAGFLSPELVAGISRVRGVKQLGFRVGNWLSADECSSVLKHAYGTSLRAR